jgi:hypothetical protein
VLDVFCVVSLFPVDSKGGVDGEPRVAGEWRFGYRFAIMLYASAHENMHALATFF